MFISVPIGHRKTQIEQIVTDMKNFVQQTIADIFIVSVITLAVYFFAELLKPGLVTDYVSLNLLLLWTVVIGIIRALKS